MRHISATFASPQVDRGTPPERAGAVRFAGLSVGRRCDRFEAEADRVAAAVTRTPPAPEAILHSVVDAPPAPFARDGGGSLPGSTLAYLEPRFGVELGGVRVHAGTDAAEAATALNARAFTVGRDIFFGHGRYAPATSPGRELLAHEITHVIQQSPRPAGGTAPGVIAESCSVRVQRSDLEDGAEEGAGSCIGFGSPSLTGMAAHNLIQRNCGGCKGPALEGGGRAGGWGFLDLYRSWSPREAKQMGFSPESFPTGRFVSGDVDVMEIGEIKPDSWKSELGTLAAMDQLQRYLRVHTIQYAPGNRWGNPPRSAVPMVTYRGIASPGVEFGPGGQRLTCESLRNGLYFYSCTRPRKKDKEAKQQAAGTSAAMQGAQPQQATGYSVAKALRTRAPWLPADLADRIAVEPEGLHRYEDAAAWSGGFPGTVVAYVNRRSGEIQVYHEFPEDLRFYERLKAVQAKSPLWRGDAARRLHQVFSEYNRDLWSLIAPREEGQLFHLSPDYAKAWLRGIYAQLFRQVVEASAAMLGAGATTAQTMSTMRGAAGQLRSTRTVRGVAGEPRPMVRPSTQQVPPFLQGPPANDQVEELIQLLKAG